MKLRAMDSLDLVERLMLIEEVFEADIPDALVSPGEIVDLLEVQLSNRRPNKAARALLKKLAHSQQRSELAEELDRPWRREQIAAILHEIFR